MHKTTKKLLHNTCVVMVSMTAATAISFYFHHINGSSVNIALFYILAIVLTARYTSNYMCGVIASLAGVISINYLFTYPYFELNFQLSGYPLTFLVMLIISLITSTATTHMKENARILSEREKQLTAAEKEKMRANLLRAVSHDLRTPLTSIIGASNTYLDNGDTLSEAQKRELVAHIAQDSNWLLNMVENLLSVTRIHDDVAKVTKSLEPIEEVVSEAVYRLKKRLPQASIKVKVPDDLVMIPMDAILIEQVIINLLENAVVHSHSRDPIQCLVTCDRDTVAFHIIDFGIGIDPDQLDSIFESGSLCCGKSSDSSKGMGIGLSICKTIILAHNGTITARNHSEGAEFIFTLPRDGEAHE